MLKLVLIIAAGAAAGAVLGGTRGTGATCCPLIATPLRGALYGACLAALAAFAFVGVSGMRGGANAESSSKHLVHIKSEDQFERDVLNASQPVLVDFYADWCGPCKRLAPILSELADELAGKARVAKVNVDEEKSLSKKYGISSIPDVRVFSGGKQVDAAMGLRDKSFYLGMIQKAGREDTSTTPPAPATGETSQ